MQKLGPEEQQRASEILIGLENKKILIWDGYMDCERLVIETPQGIGALYTFRLTSEGPTQIISGTINNYVYVHDLNGKEQWSYQAQLIELANEFCWSQGPFLGHRRQQEFVQRMLVVPLVD